MTCDDRQQVVEVMRHTTRQPPDRIHLLRLPQLRFNVCLLLLRPLALDGVPHGAHQQVAIRLSLDQVVLRPSLYGLDRQGFIVGGGQGR